MTTSTRRARRAWSAALSEPSFAAYCDRYSDSGLSPLRYAVSQPVKTVLAVGAATRLPRHTAVLDDSTDGRVIRRTLTRPSVLGLRLGVAGVSILEIPADAEDYLAGASKQTLRRKIRAASRAGVTFRLVTDRGEKLDLLELAEKAELTHPDPRYRREHPQLGGLLAHDLWLVGQAADGSPLLLSVTPTCGEWALLEYFRTLGRGPVESDSRYLGTYALVQALATRGVRRLLDGRHPLGLPAGLRHFQRMVGFRIARIRVVREPAAG